MPPRTTRRSDLVLPTLPLDELAATLPQFSQAVAKRGRDYANTRRVGPLHVEGSLVTAAVFGTDTYATSWEWIEDQWYPECTCPVGPYCKHAYAVACRVLALATTEGWAESRPAPVAPRTSLLERLRVANNTWDRERLLGEALGGAPKLVAHLHRPVWQSILSEPDPDVFCWLAAREILHHSDGWLPRELAPYREREDLAATVTRREREAVASALLQWAAQQRGGGERHLRVVFTLERDAAGRVDVMSEARLTTPRMADEPRTMSQLMQLRSEVRRNAQLLPPDQVALLDWLADERGSLGYFATARSLSGTALRVLLTRIADSPLASWASTVPDDLAARAGVAPGDPVRLRRDPVRILPQCVARDGEMHVDLCCFWSDGTTRRLDEVVYVSGAQPWSAPAEPSFILADGSFSLVVEEPPAALREQFQRVGGLAVPAAERGPLLARLTAAFPHLYGALGAHTCLHRVVCSVALDLRADDWMQIRLFAVAASEAWQPGAPVADGTVLFEYTPDGAWTRVAGRLAAAPDDAPTYEGIAVATPLEVTPAAAVPGDVPTDGAVPEGDVWIEAPDPTCVEPIVAWLATVHAAPGTRKLPGGHRPDWPDATVGWWMLARRRRMEEFADAWDRRPSGVAYFGTDGVRRLLSGTDRVVPQIRIESSGVDWFAVSADWQAEGLQLSDADIAKLRAATTRFVRLPSGWVRRDAVAVQEQAALVLADLGVEPGQGSQRLTLWQLAGAKPESLQALEHLGADAAALRAVQQLRTRVAGFTGLPSVPVPTGLRAELRPYQQRGLDFLAYTAGLGIGAVLADDMGLGKTVQALAWLLHMREQEPQGGPSLVVCPASVVHNWAREAAHFAPALRVLLLTSGSERHALRRDIATHDLIVTTYALLRRDLEEWRSVDLRAAILDEAQNIKNPDAVVSRAALALRARHRLALTGTPLENRALDLWSIMAFVNPGYLGSRGQFSARFDRPDAPAHVRTLLAAKLRPVLLRRMKREVATDLPERIEERRDCELGKQQRQLYLAELKRSRALVDELAAAPGGVRQNKITILAALTRLRQICCHPALVGGRSGLESGKFEALFELLEPLLAEGHKVLLFSQFVQCLKLLAKEMQRRHIAHHTLTGQTVKREQVVTAFQEDPQPGVFLISLKAGGTGLNLTAASYVVLFDPWWNPAVEAQAIDRTHRIGQDRTVIAYRMLALGTIEEKIWELQQRKAALARDILGEDGFARSLTRADLDYLLAEA